MPTLTPLLTHLALMIDLKEERLEKMDVPFLRQRLSAELQGLFKRFETEYEEYLAATEEPQRVEILSRAA